MIVSLKDKYSTSHENQPGGNSAERPAAVHVDELRARQSANDYPKRRADQNRNLQLLPHKT